MNALQIEIFNGKERYIITSNDEVNLQNITKDIISSIDELKEISLKESILFQLSCFISCDAICVDEKRPAHIMICRCDTNSISHYALSSISNITSEVMQFIEENKGVRINHGIDIEKYDGLAFSKKAIAKILMATQQYFVVNALCLDNKLTVDVITPNGIEKLFREGQSQIVFSPIVDVDQWEGIMLMLA